MKTGWAFELSLIKIESSYPNLDSFAVDLSVGTAGQPVTCAIAGRVAIGPQELQVGLGLAKAETPS